MRHHLVSCHLMNTLYDKMDSTLVQLKSIEHSMKEQLLKELSGSFLHPSPQRAETLLKALNDLFKIEKQVQMPTGLPTFSKSAHFFTDGLDAEQTWNLLHAANHELLKPVKKLAYKVCATEGADRSLFALKNLDGNEDDNFADDKASDKVKSLKTKQRRVKFAPTIEKDDEDIEDAGGFDDGINDDELSEEKSTDNAAENPFRNRSSLPVSSVPKKTQVDDKFFHLQEMDQYLQWVEERDGADEGADSRFDVFTDINNEQEDDDDDAEDADDNPDDDSDADSERASGKSKLRAPSVPQYRYADFFDEIPTAEPDNNASGAGKARNSTRKSTHEQRQAKTDEHVRNLEADRLEDKEWHLRGEIQARERPENSVLEKFVEFDHVTRGAPVVTEHTSRNIENLIQQRIKDQIWDNVERKVKPAQVDPYEFKKRLLLDQEKPKQSLAQIYEQDYLRKTAAESGSGLATTHADANNPAHSSIRQKMATLFTQLDALSNFTFAPRPVAPEIKLQPAAPAYEREEVNVLAVADSNVLAPEELHRSLRRGGKRSELTAADERTDTDRKRELRKKKLRQGASANTKTTKAKEDEQETKRKAAKHAKFALNTSTQFFERLQKHVQKEVGEKKTPTAGDAATNADGKRSNSAQATKKVKKVKRDGASNGPNAVAFKFG